MKPLSLSFLALLALCLATSTAVASPEAPAGGSGAWRDGHAERAETPRAEPVDDDTRVGADRVRRCIADARQEGQASASASRRGHALASCIRGGPPSVR